MFPEGAFKKPFENLLLCDPRLKALVEEDKSRQRTLSSQSVTSQQDSHEIQYSSTSFSPSLSSSPVMDQDLYMGCSMAPRNTSHEKRCPPVNCHCENSFSKVSFGFDWLVESFSQPFLALRAGHPLHTVLTMKEISQKNPQLAQYLLHVLIVQWMQEVDAVKDDLCPTIMDVQDAIQQVRYLFIPAYVYSLINAWLFQGNWQPTGNSSIPTMLNHLRTLSHCDQVILQMNPFPMDLRKITTIFILLSTTMRKTNRRKALNFLPIELQSLLGFRAPVTSQLASDQLLLGTATLLKIYFAPIWLVLL